MQNALIHYKVQFKHLSCSLKLEWQLQNNLIKAQLVGFSIHIDSFQAVFVGLLNLI